MQETKGVGFILWIFVALEVDVALICASAPVIKPLFRRYFNNSNSSHSASNHYGLSRRAAKSQHGHLEAGLSFHDAFEVPVELHSVNHSNLSNETQKPLPSIPPHSDTKPAKKDNDDSDESVFIIQQVEIDPKKSMKFGCGRGKGERCQKINELWARKEPWSGV
jgi:hypothetical protein